MRARRVGIMAFFAIILCLFTVSAFAANVSVVSAGDMLTRITSQFPALMRLVTAFAYVCGIYFIIAAVYRMKHLGEMRTMMSHERSFIAPLIYLVVGSALLYLPGAVQSGVSTFWSEPNPYAYVANQSSLPGVISTCFIAVQLFGVIAFIRGLIILSHLANQGGGGQQPLARGITHIVGGIFCINIYGFVKMILYTIGVSISGF